MTWFLEFWRFAFLIFGFLGFWFVCFVCLFLLFQFPQLSQPPTNRNGVFYLFFLFLLSVLILFCFLRPFVFFSNFFRPFFPTHIPPTMVTRHLITGMAPDTAIHMPAAMDMAIRMPAHTAMALPMALPMVTTGRRWVQFWEVTVLHFSLFELHFGQLNNDDAEWQKHRATVPKTENKNNGTILALLL